jgi:hypothetical protein
MNKVKCKDCRHYDAIRSGQSKNPKHGWCTVKSIYPFREEVGGPVFPPGVRRVSSPELPAKPEIVEGDSVVSNCSKVSAK